MKKIVKLAKPIELFGKRVAEVELREPSGGDYVRIGDPRVAVHSPTGSAYWVEQNEIVEKYFDKCIVHEAGGAIVNMLGLEDAMAVKAEILGFFTEAAVKTAARKSTPSSSGSAS